MEDKELLQEEESNIFSFIDEEGNEIELEYLDNVFYQGKEYLVMMPIDEEDNAVVILEVEPQDDENENYLSVDDDETQDAVFAIFKENNKDILEFAD